MNLENKLIGKIQSVCFKLNMLSKGVLRIPAQTAKEIRIFKKLFDNYADKEIRIFEWGGGRSTIYYGEYLKKNGIKFQWNTVDNNKIWFEKVCNEIKKKGLGDNVSLHLREFLSFWEKPGWGEIPPPCGVFRPKTDQELGYINMPKEIGGKFDIIIIDARFRRHCIKVAEEVLAINGIVVIHDAQKTHYHQGMENYKHRKFFTTGSWYPFQELKNSVWVGSMENDGIFKELSAFEAS